MSLRVHSNTILNCDSLLVDCRFLPSCLFHAYPVKRFNAWRGRDLAEEIANNDSFFGTRDALVRVEGYYKQRTYNGHTTDEFVIRSLRWA